MDLPWERALIEVGDAGHAIELAAAERMQALIYELREHGVAVSSIGIVGASERNLAATASPHIRAHAAEGVLFRRVLEVGAKANDVPWSSHSERGFETAAAASLGLSIGGVRARLATLGRALGSPWGSDEKAAAMAAWIGLERRRAT